MSPIMIIAITIIVCLGLLTAVGVVRYRIELEKYRKAMENAVPRAEEWPEPPRSVS